MDKDPSARDLYNWAYAHYQAGNFETSDSLFCKIFVPKYPDQIYGYLWCSKARLAQDTTMEKRTCCRSLENFSSKAIELDTTADKNTNHTLSIPIFTWHSIITI